MSSTHTPDLNPALVEDAVKALIKYERKKQSEGGKAQLIDDLPKYIYVQIQLKKPIAQKVQKPVRVKIPHSLFNAEDEEHSVCLFCKTDDKEKIEKYLEEHPVAGLKKVLGMNDVKKQLKDFKARKALLAEHTHFLCHTAIARQLYNSLGKDFAKRNAFPVQCSFSEPAQLCAVVSKAVSASYLHLAGSNLVLPLGKLSLSLAENKENVLEGVRFAVNEKVTGAWSSVKSVHVKTKDSAALPVFTNTEGDAVIAFMHNQARAAAPAAAATTTAAAPENEKKQKKRERESEAPAEVKEKVKKTKVAAPAPVAVAVAVESNAADAAPAKKKKVAKK